MSNLLSLLTNPSLLSLLTNPRRIGLFTFRAKCPNCGNKLKATRNKFYCKGCDKRGGADDYKKWLWQIDQKKLTHLVETGLDSKEMSDWWLQRY